MILTLMQYIYIYIYIYTRMLVCICDDPLIFCVRCSGYHIAQSEWAVCRACGCTGVCLRRFFSLRQNEKMYTTISVFGGYPARFGCRPGLVFQSVVTSLVRSLTCNRLDVRFSRAMVVGSGTTMYSDGASNSTSGSNNNACFDSYSYRLWSLANVWSYNLPLVGSLTGSSLLKEGGLATSPILDGGPISSIPSTCSLVAPNSIGINNNTNEDSGIGVGIGRNNNNNNINNNNNNAEVTVLKCAHCLKTFVNFETLKEHVHSVHPERTSNAYGFTCVQCSATFTNRDQLEKHEILHLPNAQVSCKVCNKTFANVYRLQRHMISHDESAVLRKFKCPQCEKAFKFKHHLKEHIRIHSGEKPFECGNCGKRFSHSGSYSSHMTSKKCLIMNLKVNHRNRHNQSSSVNNDHASKNAAGSTSNGSSSNGRISAPSKGTRSSNSVNNGNSANKILSNGHSAVVDTSSVVTARSTLNSQHVPVAAIPPPSLLIPNYPPHFNNVRHPFYLPPGFTINHPGALPYPFAPSINHFLEQLSPSLPTSGSAVTSADERSNTTEPDDGNHRDDYRLQSRISSTTATTDSISPIQRVSTPLDRGNGNVDFASNNRLHLPKTEGLAAKLEEAVVRHESMNGSNGVGNVVGPEYYNTESDESGKELPMSEDEDSESLADGNSSSGRKARVRSQIAEDQLTILRRYYSLNSRPKREELERISREVGFPIRVVQVWFQNSRARDRREGRLVHAPYSPYHVGRPSSVENNFIPHPDPQVSATVVDDNSDNPPTPDVAIEQPLDLSTKKNSSYFASYNDNSSPLSSPGVHNQQYYDSDEYGVVNLSCKSPHHHYYPNRHHRSPTTTNLVVPRHSFSDSGSSEMNHSAPSTPRNNGSDDGTIEVSASKIQTILSYPIVTNAFFPSRTSPNGLATPTAAINSGEKILYINPANSPITIVSSPNRNGSCSPASSDGRCWKQEYSSGEIDQLKDNTQDSLMSEDTTDSSTGNGNGVNTNNNNNNNNNNNTNNNNKNNNRNHSKAKRIKLISNNNSDADSEVQRPHKCEICAKAFKHKHHLTEHKRLHSGEKPFQCFKCFKRFSHSGSFSQHMNHRYSYCKPYRD